MALKNAFKVLIGNFSNVWKTLFYKLIVLFCVLGLTTVISWPIISTLIKENFFINLQTSLENVLFKLNFETIFVTISSVINNFFEILSNANLLGLTILCLVSVTILYYFLNGLCELALYQNVNGYMGSLTKYGFTNSFVLMLVKSCLLMLCKILILLPINILIMLGCFYLFTAFPSNLSLLATFVVILVLLFLSAIKLTLFSGWQVAVTVHNKPIFKCLELGFKAVIKRFYRVFSSYIIIVVCAFIINTFALTFTAGAGLLITLPLTLFTCVCYNCVMYYESMGMRYYVDSDTIISPKRLEQQDKLNKVKHII